MSDNGVYVSPFSNIRVIFRRWRNVGGTAPVACKRNGIPLHKITGVGRAYRMYAYKV